MRTCSLPDTSTIEACLASAMVGEDITRTCTDFNMWGLQFGDEIAAGCEP